MSSFTRVAVTGVDASGKTTLIEGFREHAARTQAPAILAFRGPHYHANPELPEAIRLISEAIAQMSALANERKDPALKATALFLGMTLHAPAENAISRGRRPRFVVSERHPIVDSLAFAPLYLPALRKTERAAEWENLLFARAGQSFEALLEWIETGLPEDGLALVRIPDWVESVFSGADPMSIAHFWSRFGARWPDIVVLLDAGVETLEARINARESRKREPHESRPMLELLRNSFRDAVRESERAARNLRSWTISTEHASAAAVRIALTDRLAASEVTVAQPLL